MVTVKQESQLDTVQSSLGLHILSMWTDRSSPEVINLFSCSAQLRMKFNLLINVKMPTTVGI